MTTALAILAMPFLVMNRSFVNRRVAESWGQVQEARDDLVMYAEDGFEIKARISNMKSLTLA